MMRASHINELHSGQRGRCISGGFEATILDKGIVTLLIPTLTHTQFPRLFNTHLLMTDL
jgi:hypothetical protein